MVDKMEVTWTVAVAAIVAWVFVASLGTLQAIEGPVSGTTELKVTASRFVWKFDYPDGSSIYAGEGSPLELVVGEPVHFTITSTDVIHSFFVPEIGIKIDAIPGRISDRSFTPDVAGSFMGRCYEFCGIGHHGMTFPVVIFEPGADGRPMDQTFGAAPAAEEPVDQGDGGGNMTDDEGGRDVEITLSDFDIVPGKFDAEAGETITFVITNDGPNPHNFQVKGLMDRASDTIGEGESTAVTVTIPDDGGTFTYICAIAGHEALGMKGTLDAGGEAEKDGPGFDVAIGALAVLGGVALMAFRGRRKA